MRAVSLLIMRSVVALLFFMMAACSSNKVACPTYQNSYTGKKKIRYDNSALNPESKKRIKTKSGVLPPGYK